MEVVLGTAAPETHPNQRKSAEPAFVTSACDCVQRVCRVSAIPLFRILGTEEMVDNSYSEAMVWRVTESSPSQSSKPY